MAGLRNEDVSEASRRVDSFNCELQSVEMRFSERRSIVNILSFEVIILAVQTTDNVNITKIRCLVDSRLIVFFKIHSFS